MHQLLDLATPACRTSTSADHLMPPPVEPAAADEAATATASTWARRSARPRSRWSGSRRSVAIVTTLNEAWRSDVEQARIRAGRPSGTPPRHGSSTRAAPRRSLSPRGRAGRRAASRARKQEVRREVHAATNMNRRSRQARWAPSRNRRRSHRASRSPRRHRGEAWQIASNQLMPATRRDRTHTAVIADINEPQRLGGLRRCAA